MRRVTLFFLFGALAWGVLIGRTEARQPYFDAFKDKYAKDEAYGKLVADTKCFICHVGKSKKNRNEYGIALSKVIMKKEMDKAKIEEALGKIEDEKSPTGETFGELIKAHKLPVEPKKT